MKKQLSTVLGIFGLCISLFVPFQNAEALLAGVKHTSMGATGVAYPLDAEAVAYNPAGNAFICDSYVSSMSFIHTKEQTTVTNNALGNQGVPYINGTFDANGNPWNYSPDFGINMHFCDNLTAGLAVYNNKFVKTSYSGVPQITILGNGELGLDFIQEVIAPNITYRLPSLNFDCHTIDHAFGIAFDIAVQRFKLKGLQNFDNSSYSSAPGFVTNNHFNYSWGYGFTVGWQGVFDNWLRLGATYQPRIRMHKFGGYAGFAAVGGHVLNPTEFAVGIAVTPACAFESLNLLSGFTFAFDTKYIGYGHVRALANNLYPFINVIATPPIDKLGASNGSGFGYKNQWQFKFGVEYEWDCNLTVRAGYIHLTPYYRNGQEAINLLTFEQIIDYVTIGASYMWQGNTELSFYYIHGFEKTRSGLLPIGLGGGNISMKADRDAFGFSVGRYF